MGCGTGNLTLKERHLFNNVVGLDISKSMIKKLKNKIHNNSNIELLISDCENLPIKTGCVNFVTMFSVLHHIPNIYVALKDAHRVLTQSGALFIDHEPNDHRLIRKILVYINIFLRLLTPQSFFVQKTSANNKYTIFDSFFFSNHGY